MEVASGARDVVIALDMGGSLVKAALVDRDGTLRSRQVMPTRAGGGIERVLDGLASVIELLQGAAGAAGMTVRGVGLATPGLVDAEAGVVIHSANLGWRDLPVAGLLGERCDLSITLAHDVRMAALAEGRLGAARGHRDFLMLTIGTGIGGALVLDRRLRTGAHHRAAEIGHFTVPGLDLPCPCGRHGCLELIASCRALERRHRELPGQDLPVADVVALAQSGDANATPIWDDAVAALGDAIDSAIVLFDPELIVIGGGIAALSSDLVPRLGARMSITPRLQPAARVVVAALGAWAGCAGAGLYAWSAVAAEETPVAPARVVSA